MISVCSSMTTSQLTTLPLMYLNILKLTSRLLLTNLLEDIQEECN